MIIDASQINSDISEKCDVCVVGSGAGGAVAAKELSGYGYSVIVVEEGGYFDRKDFNRSPLDMFRLLYRSCGMNTALGRPGIPIPLGMTVGGTTTVNSGTCFRVPDSVLEKWREQYGVEEISPERMGSYFDRVEGILKVAPASDEVLGRNAQLFKKGAEKLGLSGGNIRRNATAECGGCGVCAYGCPHDAKQPMHLNYIPQAIEKGAKIYARCKVERVLTEKGRAIGVEGDFYKDGEKSHGLNVSARVVILAAGTIHTPVILLNNKIGLSSGEVGKNLTVHPATRMGAMYDEIVDGWMGIPQSYYVDEYAKEGIMLEGVHGPPALMTMTLPYVGLKYKELSSRIRHFGNIGVMVSDTSKGRVRRDWRGFPFITYILNRADTDRLLKGMGVAGEISFAAGAKTLYPALRGFIEVNSLEELKRMKEARISPTDLELMAFHPLGTCRMGGDPKKSVVDSFGESHDVKNLFICDGSIFPSSMGVNPQITIMTFATRNAEYLHNNSGKYLA